MRANKIGAKWRERLYKEIDWSKGYKTLDKELIKISKKAQIKNKVADKLAEVTLKTGEQINVHIHIEIQGKKESSFEKRMFIYYYRIFERYRKPIASLAILRPYYWHNLQYWRKNRWMLN